MPCLILDGYAPPRLVAGKIHAVRKVYNLPEPKEEIKEPPNHKLEYLLLFREFENWNNQH
jgi:hypothetical protein